MFEFLKLSGSSEKGIEVQTKRGTSIPNLQAPPPDARTIQVFQALLHKHRQWVLRKEACGLYNCAGHVWASRRTAIYDQPSFELILREDDYRVLLSGEAPHHGDLVLYRIAGNGNILHVGVVSELRELTVPGSLPDSATRIPWILSKWNDTTGEVLHHYRDVPWSEYEVFFWTDRPLL